MYVYGSHRLSDILRIDPARVHKVWCADSTSTLYLQLFRCDVLWFGRTSLGRAVLVMIVLSI